MSNRVWRGWSQPAAARWPDPRFGARTALARPCAPVRRIARSHSELGPLPCSLDARAPANRARAPCGDTLLLSAIEHRKPAVKVARATRSADGSGEADRQKVIDDPVDARPRFPCPSGVAQPSPPLWATAWHSFRHAARRPVDRTETVVGGAAPPIPAPDGSPASACGLAAAALATRANSHPRAYRAHRRSLWPTRRAASQRLQLLVSRRGYFVWITVPGRAPVSARRAPAAAVVARRKSCLTRIVL